MKLLINATVILTVMAATVTAYGEKETAFLGVTTRKVDKTIRSQLEIPEGTGLVIQSVVPESPADGKVQEDDILTKIDEQLLINPEQLGVLVNSRKPKEKVNIEYIRKGKKDSTEVVLGKRPEGVAGQLDLPANIQILGPTIKAFSINEDDLLSGEKLDAKAINKLIEQELSKIDGRQFNMSSDQMSNMLKGINIDIKSIIDQAGDGNALSSSSINSIMISSIMIDEETGATLNYTVTGEDARLKIVDRAGEMVFEGPVNTDKEKDNIPEDYRKKFEELFKIQMLPSGASAIIQSSSKGNKSIKVQ